ncbi:bifunctional SulP family inorganic anion transporter/carbonic anhydrase [Streptomyces tagetis]|uniref:Bifunctional SulP family inorganic anion transporter/carbonic anhydrase n=1 Tax=Streptomyces tagetis TaxID=2820809 RepID=A0A941B0Y5_9ACTN|nr:SulP family inorganic anion transporter [Streptomyces sp. RG38]MBQ0827366.1 bifunctional SulP family inorganic anion transporter/carbonic anhydrase [Streptomyces sp. RG38]
MPARVPAHARSARTEQFHPAHSPPSGPPRRFHLAGADLSASVAVFLIALPLSLGIALATGAPLQAGLVAAAVGGIVAGRLGGSPLQVSGPAAGLTVVTADLIQRYGWRTTCAITVLAGLVQLALGCLRVARGALAVSPAIVHGILAGIGVTIAVAQIHIVLGGTPQSSVPDNLRALPAQLAHPQPADLAAGALTLTLLLLWPRLPGRAGRLLGRVPAALIAVTGATAVALLTGLRLPRVDLPSWSSHALASLPEGPVLGLAAAVLTTTLVCSVQSLLGAVAVDKLVAARPGSAGRAGRSDLDRELLGQGAANIASGALGGLPVAGVAVRSSANIAAGAVSRNSAVLHGVLIVIAALLLVPVLQLIPLASLAALVMAVGLKMVSLNHVRTVTRHREIAVYAVTTGGVVFLGVLEGVALGIAVAVAVALHRLTRTRITHDEREGVHHVRVRGPLTFLAVPRLSRVLHQIPHEAGAVVELGGSFIDHAAHEALQDWRRTHTARGGRAEILGRPPGTRTGQRPESDGDGDRSAPSDGSGTAAGRPTARVPTRPGAIRPAAGTEAAPPDTGTPGRRTPGRRRAGPAHLLLICADAREAIPVTSAAGPDEVFVVCNVGNLVPPPGEESGDDSVAAAIEYAVDVLRVRSITVCGHGRCGAMGALLRTSPSGARTPLRRWLRYGRPSLDLAADTEASWARLPGGGPVDAIERLALANVVQQVEHLRAHEAVSRAVREGRLELRGRYAAPDGTGAYSFRGTQRAHGTPPQWAVEPGDPVRSAIEPSQEPEDPVRKAEEPAPEPGPST